jgi:hypothetical protein
MLKGGTFHNLINAVFSQRIAIVQIQLKRVIMQEINSERYFKK